MSLAWLAILIPLIASGILFFLYRDKTCWWEYALVIGPSLLFIFLMKIAMVSYNTSDIEYLGDYITHVQHYDHWDEWITQTCSYQTCSGSGKDRSCTTHYYDCSYRKDHPEYWVKVTSGKNEIEISEQEYNTLAKQFNTAQQEVEMNRNFYRIDGDAQAYPYNGEILRVESVSSEHSYANKVKASGSVFKFESITTEEAGKWKLYNYPAVENNSQSTVLGASVRQATQKKLDYLNGYDGPNHQIRVYIVVYKDQPYTVVNKQLSYWQGGNKNELLIHLGVDATGQLKWYDATSWMDKPEVTARIKTFLAGQKQANIGALADFLIPTVERYWHRKSFSDFDYLDIELSPNQLMWIIISILIYNVGISIWVVFNNYKLF